MSPTSQLVLPENFMYHPSNKISPLVGFKLSFSFQSLMFRVKFFEMNQYPGLVFFGEAFVFRVIMSYKPVGRIGRGADIDFIGFRSIYHVGIMLVHDREIKKPGFNRVS